MNDEPLTCPACGRNDFRDEQGRGGHLATVQDDTHRSYREEAGLTSANDLSRLLAPAPRPYNVPRLPTPRTTTDGEPDQAAPEPEREAPEPEPWPHDAEPARVFEPEVMPAPRPVRVVRVAPEPEPEPRGPSPLGIVLGILGTAALAVLAFGVGRAPGTAPAKAPEVRMGGGPSGFDARSFR